MEKADIISFFQIKCCSFQVPSLENLQKNYKSLFYVGNILY